MHETELFVTKIFNDHLAGVANWALGLVGMHQHSRPWANFIVMELLVAAIIVVVFAILRPRLSATAPGKLQHTFEVIYEFVNGQADEQVGHDGTPTWCFSERSSFWDPSGNRSGSSRAWSRPPWRRPCRSVAP